MAPANRCRTLITLYVYMHTRITRERRYVLYTNKLYTYTYKRIYRSRAGRVGKRNSSHKYKVSAAAACLRELRSAANIDNDGSRVSARVCVQCRNGIFRHTLGINSTRFFRASKRHVSFAFARGTRRQPFSVRESHARITMLAVVHARDRRSTTCWLICRHVYLTDIREP